MDLDAGGLLPRLALLVQLVLVFHLGDVTLFGCERDVVFTLFIDDLVDSLIEYFVAELKHLDELEGDEVTG